METFCNNQDDIENKIFKIYTKLNVLVTEVFSINIVIFQILLFKNKVQKSNFSIQGRRQFNSILLNCYLKGNSKCSRHDSSW